MYHSHRQQLESPDFYLPFSGQLNPDNRWVKLATLVPWELAEEIYHANLCQDFGAPIVPARVALGALIIKERLRLTDRETVETIRENPYLQFFIGKPEFAQTRPFDASLMVDFRKRFGETGMQQIAQAIALKSLDRQARSLMTIIGSVIRNDLGVHAYLEVVLRRVLAGETDWALLVPHAWKTDHPEAIRVYRKDERRQAAGQKRVRRARRRKSKKIVNRT